MLTLLIGFMLFAVAVEILWSMFRETWRFSISDLLLVTFFVSVVLVFITAVIQNDF